MPTLKRKLRQLYLRIEADDEIATPAGFEPGQSSMLYVYGVAELPISISGDPEERGALVYTITSGRQCRRTSAGDLKEGQRIGMRGPSGIPAAHA